MLMLVGEWSHVCRGLHVCGPEDVGDELSRALGELLQEVLLVLPLDGEGRVLECTLIAVGSANRVEASGSDVWRRAISLGARRILVAHNHPSGSTSPTQADLAFTRRHLEVGLLLGMELTDHLIVARDSWRSLRESTELWGADVSLK